MSSRAINHLRASTYYWKCDRPAAFHGTTSTHDHARWLDQVQRIVEEQFGAPANVQPGPGQGNHITYTAKCRDLPLFIRIDDGPEQDDYLAVESAVQNRVRALGVPSPEVYATDAERRTVPFAWQIMEHLDVPDLNQHFKSQVLDLPAIARETGRSLAKWQSLKPKNFGPFNPIVLQQRGTLEGFHRSYPDYFFLHLERHLKYLVDNGFFSIAAAAEIEHEILLHQGLLQLEHGCLVHKDLALWNILGTHEKILGFIDWDDSISGDPMDDFSLLACFHGPEVITSALEGYQDTQPLPSQYQRRFWLHLLRNMIVKAVIRTGAGYFERSGAFFLINQSVDLRTFTEQRIRTALEGLRKDHPVAALGAA